MYNIKKVLIKIISVSLILTLINQSVLSGIIQLSPSGANECNLNLEIPINTNSPGHNTPKTIINNHKKAVLNKIWKFVKIDYINEHIIFFLVITSLVILLDQTTKFIVISTIPEGNKIWIIKWVLFLINGSNPYSENIYLSLFFLFAGTWAAWHLFNLYSKINNSERSNKILSLMSGLIIGAHFSLVFDELVRGRVIDWICYRNASTNIADLFLWIGLYGLTRPNMNWKVNSFKFKRENIHFLSKLSIYLFLLITMPVGLFLKAGEGGLLIILYIISFYEFMRFFIVKVLSFENNLGNNKDNITTNPETPHHKISDCLGNSA